jgi:hypothetical protein
MLAFVYMLAFMQKSAPRRTAHTLEPPVLTRPAPFGWVQGAAEGVPMAEVKLNSWASVAAAKVVYVGLSDRAEFDRIALPTMDHREFVEVERKQLLSKMAQDASGVLVIFQHWLA